jgi:hypothetical protein
VERHRALVLWETGRACSFFVDGLSPPVGVQLTF